MAEKQFVNGLIVKKNDKAPVWIVCGLSFKVEEFIKYLNDNQANGWLNVDVKLSKTGKYYAELNTYKRGEVKGKAESPERIEKEEPIDYPAEDIDLNSIPF